MRLTPLLLLPPLLLLGGCGQDATLRSDAPPPSLVGSWELVEGRVEGHPLAPPPGTRATLVVEEDARRHLVLQLLRLPL